MSTPYKITFYEDAVQEAAQVTANPAAAAMVTREEIAEIIDSKLASLKVYVVESDITEAQSAVKSVVELASY